MEGDDVFVGRILGRREALRLLSAAGAVALTGCGRPDADPGTAADSVGAAPATAGDAALPACMVKPEMTIGPYFLDGQLDRSDIRAEPSTGAMKEGVPLALAFNVSRMDQGTCAPFAGCLVDIWQCDAAGSYSGFADPGQGFDTVGQKFLRGFQITDEQGTARFLTIVPGWYQGRGVHIHFRIRTAPAAAQSYDFTSQLFLDDALIDQIHARPPYAAKGQRDLRNAADGIYQQGGDQLVLTATPTPTGYGATFSIGLDMSDATTGAPDEMGRGGPGGRPGGPGRGGPPPGGRPGGRFRGAAPAHRPPQGRDRRIDPTGQHRTDA